jgi:glycosyltransferase involved in cell wall biosynthesis
MNANQRAMIELSIVIPTYNRVARLRACLEALDRQAAADGVFEVIVVVDGSSDGTMQMLEAFEASFPLVPVWQENAGQPTALNRGIAEARGRYCLFIDDDIVTTPDVVAEHLGAQRSRDNVAAIGQLTLLIPDDADWYLRAFAAGWRRHYADLAQRSDALTWEDCYSGNLSVPRALLVRSGGFSTEISRGFDVELAGRLQRLGASFVYLPGAVGAQDERKGFRELSRDGEQAGYSDATLYLRDPANLSTNLGWFCHGDWRKVLLRRVLLKLGVPVALLAAFGPLLPSGAQQLWQSFLQNLSYWRGVRRAIADAGLWARISEGVAILDYPAGADRSDATQTSEPTAAARHLRWMRRLGYRPLGIEEFLRCQRERRFPSPRSVVVMTGCGIDRPGLNGVSTPPAGLHYIRMSGDESVVRLLLALKLGIAGAFGPDRSKR